MPDSVRHAARTHAAYSKKGLLLTLGVVAAMMSVHASEPINLTGLKLLSVLPVIWLSNSLETVRLYPATRVLTLPLIAQSVGRLVLYTIFLGILFHSTTRTEESFVRFCAITFPVLCGLKLLTLMLERRLARAKQETLALTPEAKPDFDRNFPW